MRLNPLPSYRQILTWIVLVIFTANYALPSAYAQALPIATSKPGELLHLSPTYSPALIKGLTINPDNPLEFDFIIDRGDASLTDDEFKTETLKLVKYFLATLTIPSKDLWVNLSPYEADRIIPNAFGETEMGRDLLSQDYILKQMTSSLMHPETDLGKEFWDRIHQKAQELYGTTDIPTSTFNKVWIVPDKIMVYEHGQSAFVAEGTLKVMLEDDYLAMSSVDSGSNPQATSDESMKDIIKQVILPEIEKEINEGKNFANLRQIYHSMILAIWFKRNLKESILGKVYAGQNKIDGVDVADKDIKQKIYDQYVEAFKQGVYNYIKEEYDPATQQIIPRKYFSGGVLAGDAIEEKLATSRSPDVGRQAQGLLGRFVSRARVALDPRRVVSRKIISGVAALTTAFALNAKAVTPETTQYLKLDSALYGVVLDPSKTYAQLFDMNLDQMLAAYSTSGPTIIHDIFAQLKAANPNATFDDLAKAVRAQRKSAEGSDKARLYRESAYFLQGFIINDASYVKEDLLSPLNQSVVRVIIGNPDEGGARTYLCKTFSELLAFLFFELTGEKDILTVAQVKTLETGEVFPQEIEGQMVGHEVAVFMTPGERFIIDQGGFPNHPETVLFDREGNPQTVNVSTLPQFTELKGSTIDDLLQERKADLQLKEINRLNEEIAKSQQSSAQKAPQYRDLYTGAMALKGSKYYQQSEIFRTNVDNTLAALGRNVQNREQGARTEGFLEEYQKKIMSWTSLEGEADRLFKQERYSESEAIAQRLLKEVDAAIRWVQGLSDETFVGIIDSETEQPQGKGDYVRALQASREIYLGNIRACQNNARLPKRAEQASVQDFFKDYQARTSKHQALQQKAAQYFNQKTPDGYRQAAQVFGQLVSNVEEDIRWLKTVPESNFSGMQNARTRKPITKADAIAELEAFLMQTRANQAAAESNSGNATPRSIPQLSFNFSDIEMAGIPDVTLTAGDEKNTSQAYLHRVIERGLPKELRGMQNKPLSERRRLLKRDALDRVVIPIDGLLRRAGVFGHIGLGTFYGEPVVYIDSSLPTWAQALVMQHEWYEIEKWETKRKEMNKTPQEMREWMRANSNDDGTGPAQIQAKEWHDKAPSLERLYRMPQYRAILALGKAERAAMQLTAAQLKRYKEALKDSRKSISGLINFFQTTFLPDDPEPGPADVVLTGAEADPMPRVKPIAALREIRSPAPSAETATLLDKARRLNVQNQFRKLPEGEDSDIDVMSIAAELRENFNFLRDLMRSIDPGSISQWSILNDQKIMSFLFFLMTPNKKGLYPLSLTDVQTTSEFIDRNILPLIRALGTENSDVAFDFESVDDILGFLVTQTKTEEDLFQRANFVAQISPRSAAITVHFLGEHIRSSPDVEGDFIDFQVMPIVLSAVVRHLDLVLGSSEPEDMETARDLTRIVLSGLIIPSFSKKSNNFLPSRDKIEEIISAVEALVPSVRKTLRQAFERFPDVVQDQTSDRQLENGVLTWVRSIAEDTMTRVAWFNHTKRYSSEERLGIWDIARLSHNDPRTIQFWKDAAVDVSTVSEGFVNALKDARDALFDEITKDPQSLPVDDAAFTKGGIDFMNVEDNLESTGQGVQFNLPANLRELQSPLFNGFSPRIIQIGPANLPQLLGLPADINKEIEISYN